MGDESPARQRAFPLYVYEGVSFVL
jgi:hypothetical protein